MPSAAVVRELVGAGLEGERLVAACERIDAAERRVERGQTGGALRTRRWRERHGNVTERHGDAPSLPLDAPPNPPPAPPETPPYNPPTPKEPRSPSVSTPRSELGIVLDEETTEAVIVHRQRMRKPLTAHAAKLLAGKLAQAENPNAAADEMILRGWQSWDIGWHHGTRSRGPPHDPRLPKPGSVAELQYEAMQRLANGDYPPDDEPSFPLIESH